MKRWKGGKNGHILWKAIFLDYSRVKEFGVVLKNAAPAGQGKMYESPIFP